ncbi:helix-turn-helix domain-containing protein [Vagococcus bubulae]|uniref:HTH cro/C1-type domain-containing protein n=1 Tax=Vagococcus bubulae TaxID=1977868 RepID=A0A429ZE22_9ENTE|nr:helix-turn-helix transcriptional regulator [Vagococcus bubulae]RST91923.1 hypothetical protein CBF36_09370 [Vagococcus bubulae]
MKKSLGDRIKSIRLEKGYTMEDFGKFFQTSKGTVNNWEKNRNKPNRENLKKIAEIGNVSVDYLIGLSDFKNEYEMNLYKEQFKQLSQYQSQQVNAIVSNIKYLLVELEKNQDEDTKQNVLDSLTNTISYLALYSSEDSKKIDNLITTLTYLFDGLRGIYSLRYKNDNEKNSYKNYLELREQLIKNIDDFYNMNK